jgi:hypothetical protein
MKTERKIALVAKKLNFKEAEEAEHEYWANTTVEERLWELIELRRMFFGDTSPSIQKIVSKRSIYAEED